LGYIGKEGGCRMDNLKKEVKDLVAEILNEKEQADVSERLEAALEDYKNEIESLQSNITSRDNEIALKNEEIETLKEERETLKNELSTIKSERDTLTEEKAQIKNDLDNVSKELENIKKENTARARVAKLIEAELIKSDEETSSKYFDKVRDKEDSEFDAYFEELKEIKSSIIAEIEANKAKDDKDDEDEKNRKNKEDKKLIDPVLAALNFEIQPTPDLKEKYAKMWEKEDK
jgi:FtsZ-binding cell division protein ZapB